MTLINMRCPLMNRSNELHAVNRQKCENASDIGDVHAFHNAQLVPLGQSLVVEEEHLHDLYAHA